MKTRRTVLVLKEERKRSDLLGRYQSFGCIASQLHAMISPHLDDSDFRDRYFLTSLLSKLGTTEVTDEDRRANAVAGWYSDEAFNKKTEKRLRDLWYGVNSISEHRIHGIPIGVYLGEAAALIRDVLPPWSNSFYEHSMFTNGSAVGYPKVNGDPVYKYAGRVTVTRSAYARVYALICATPPWREYLINKFGSVEKAIRVVKGEKGFTVRKNAETDRFCSKQPTGNMLLQKAQGYVIRQSLHSVGINLNDQRRNRNAARRASITAKDATLDMKSASNSMIMWLLMHVMPEDWVRELFLSRSSICQPEPGAPWVTTIMVGAMGNGYTFELESLIFWALSEACRRITRAKGRTLVFGDDIVVPVKCVHHVRALLQFCGFRINHDKSFWTGHFRESCGGHYMKGVDVTPIYIRKPINDTTRVIWFLNRLRSWSNMGGGVCDPRVEAVYKKLRRIYVSPTLWGGVRSSSTTSLWTPNPRRERLRMGIQQTRLRGVPALLRTFQYMSPASKHLLAREAKYHGDIQAYYEVFGDVMISASMEHLTSVSEVPVGCETNTEQWSEDCPRFGFEL